MNIEEVKDLLGYCRFMRAPEHVFITDEIVHDDAGHNFRGLQPTWRRDIIFLSAQANQSTIPHETWHANTGLGELTAYPIGNIVTKKIEMVKTLAPRLKGLRLRALPDYEEVNMSEDEFPAMAKYKGRVRHYRRVR